MDDWKDKRKLVGSIGKVKGGTIKSSQQGPAFVKEKTPSSLFVEINQGTEEIDFGQLNMIG